MAETDRFLLEALEQSGCLPDSVQEIALRELTSAAFVGIVWRCLAKIQADEPHLELSVPRSFEAPVGVAGRHRVGSQLANILKELGYAGDCGYNHFLYPNEKETRNILSWLIGKLPRAASDGASTTVSTAPAATVASVPDVSDCLAAEPLADIFSSWMKMKTLYVLPNRATPRLRGFEKLPLRTVPVAFPWLQETPSKSSLFESAPKGSSRAVSLLEALAAAQRLQALDVDVLDAVDDLEAETDTTFGGRLEDEVISTDNVPLVGSSSEGVENEFSGSSTHFPAMPPFFVSAANVLRENQLAQEQEASWAEALASNRSESRVSTDEVESYKEEADQAQLESIHSRLVETQLKIETLRVEVEREQNDLVAIQRRVDETKAQGLILKKEVASKRQMLALLPQAEENITKLESICAMNETKLAALATEWEAHTRPLVDEEKALLSMKSNRKARCRQFIAEMKTFRAEMKEMAASIQDKMEATRALEKTYASLPRNVNRSSYTNRIMDIIKQVHKQKQDITKIVDDIKSIQKQLNASSEKLKRSEAVTEEKLFGEASKQVNNSSSFVSKDASNPYVECYRKFAEVREMFEELIMVVGDVGKKENTARDLENWITQLQGRDSSGHLDKVLADLQSVRDENTTLSEQLRALRST